MRSIGVPQRALLIGVICSSIGACTQEARLTFEGLGERVLSRHWEVRRTLHPQ